MKLYSFFQSSSAYRVRIALGIKDIKYDMEYINLTKGEQANPEYAAINPQMIVPTLIDNGNKISQSLAIMEYLEESYPLPHILPGDLLARAYVRELALIIACDISPLGNLKVRKYLAEPLGHDKEIQEKWIRHWIASGLAAFEEILANSKLSGRFCYSDSPTIADCCLIPQLFNARRFGCDVTPYTHIMRIEESCSQHPAFITAHPGKQVDAV